MADDHDHDSRSRDETPTERPPARRSMNGRRALGFRRGRKSFQRCSRCHTEVELSAKPLLYDANQTPIETNAATLAAIMVGNELLGFVCSECFVPLLQHVCSVFPDSLGFPLVDHHGQLVTPPRCDTCDAALAYSSDGMSVLCPHCDEQQQTIT